MDDNAQGFAVYVERHMVEVWTNAARFTDEPTLLGYFLTAEDAVQFAHGQAVERGDMVSISREPFESGGGHGFQRVNIYPEMDAVQLADAAAKITPRARHTG